MKNLIRMLALTLAILFTFGMSVSAFNDDAEIGINYVDDVNIGNAKTNMSGKLSFSVELNSNPQKIKVEKH